MLSEFYNRARGTVTLRCDCLGMKNTEQVSYRNAYLNLKVTELRRELKRRAVEYKGGVCTRCGFKGSAAAFDFHHTDPDQKDFGISGSYKSFDRIRPELDKTILLCSNCHREIHDEWFSADFALRKAEFETRARPTKGRRTGEMENEVKVQEVCCICGATTEIVAWGFDGNGFQFNHAAGWKASVLPQGRSSDRFKVGATCPECHSRIQGVAQEHYARLELLVRETRRLKHDVLVRDIRWIRNSQEWSAQCRRDCGVILSVTPDGLTFREKDECWKVGLR